MTDQDMDSIAHLLRRAGFGATRDEIEAYAVMGYEETVEELLHPERQPIWEEDLYIRDFPDLQDRTAGEPCQVYWTYRMIATQRPLEEKLALFWHSILCTGGGKGDNTLQVTHQIEMFRQYGMGSFRDLLVELSKDPAMLYYLDNTESHKDSVNENYGRELLELFSMGVGMDGSANYTEDDVKACSRAFTGWSVETPLPLTPYAARKWHFVYDPGDHDDGEKTFLGETGRWNGEDIIDIIVRQPSTARFICRHLYSFFVADEPQVPNWTGTAPQDVAAIELLEKTFVESDYDIRQVLRVLFNSDFFKSARFKKIKSPAEVVVGTMRLVGDYKAPKPGLLDIVFEMTYMGQELLNPPSVEGWNSGRGWIDSGSLVGRTNFVADQLGKSHLPGVQAILDRIEARSDADVPEGFVDACLDLLGRVEVTGKTRSALVSLVQEGGPLDRTTEEGRREFRRRAVQVMQVISASAEYQYA